MNNNFYPVVGEDGSLSLYNTEVQDIYHSKIGACTEAKTKFVKTSAILEYVKNSNQVRILDICYGLGYNTKIAVSEILKVNPECKIKIDALEIDPKVLAVSCLYDSVHINSAVNSLLAQIISRNTCVKEQIQIFANHVTFKQFYGFKISRYIKTNIATRVVYLKTPRKPLFLHNTYYRTVSSRNSLHDFPSQLKKNISFKLYLEDARNSIKKLKGGYDFIFHDGFTPSKLPTLWSVEFFKALYDLLNQNGNITTYSSSASIRSAMRSAGFYIGNGCLINDKSFGTVGYKNVNLIKNKLSDKELGLLNTKAGIPYFDPELSDMPDKIIQRREQMIKNSNLISSSRYFKDKK